MSPEKKSLDDAWFAALGGKEQPGADAAETNHARLLRAQFLQRALETKDDNSLAHQSEQLTRLMARLEAGGYFAEKPGEPPTAAKTWFGWFRSDPRKWAMLIAAPMAVAFTVIGVTLQHDNAQTTGVVMRGSPGLQKRLVDNPAEQAAALCAQLATFAFPCQVDADAAGVSLTAKVGKDGAGGDFLRAQELVVNDKGELLVRFEKR